jgi:L-fucose mutarotase
VLKGIPATLTPDLLWAIAAMGHGDKLAVVDANYPAHALHERVVTIAGTPLARVVRDIATFFPLDDFVDPAAFRMTPDGDPDHLADVHREVRDVLVAAESRDLSVAPLERTAFYAAARESFAVVATTDVVAFGCFLLTKGVVTHDPGGL